MAATAALVVGRLWRPRAAFLPQPRVLARLAALRTDRPGAERVLSAVAGVAGEEEEEDDVAGDELHTDPAELAAVDALAPAAPAYHKHAAGGRSGRGPPPSDDFAMYCDEDDSPYDDEFAENRELGAALKRAQRPFHRFGVLQRLAHLERQESAGREPRRQRPPGFGGLHFGDDEPVRVRVLDVDALPLEDLHRAFVYTLVRRRPAEVCIHIASRIAVFRDKYTHQSYENLLRDCCRLFGPAHGPELLALFARCHATISVPYMVDYTRRFGQFSRAFIAEQVERSLQPAFFDFLRYEGKGGVRPLPPVVARPWALSSYTRLMANSSVKARLIEQLRLHGQVPPGELREDTAPSLRAEVRANERLSTAGALKVPTPYAVELRRDKGEPAPPAAGSKVERPALLDAIMEAEHTGRGWDPSSQAAGNASGAHRRLRGSWQGFSICGDSVGRRGDGTEEEEHEEEEEREQEEEKEEEEEQAQGDGHPRLRPPPRGFGLQFEHVVPDNVFDVSPKDALIDISEEGRHQAPDTGFEDGIVLPDRWWGRSRRLFFRHDLRAYRIVDGQWQQVPDPRGPRYVPGRRRKAQGERREQKLKRSMLLATARNPASE